MGIILLHTSQSALRALMQVGIMICCSVWGWCLPVDDGTTIYFKEHPRTFALPAEFDVLSTWFYQEILRNNFQRKINR